MARTSSRTILLASASLIATGLAHSAMAATVTTYGGGASLPSQDYAGPNVAAPNPVPSSPSEEYTWDTANPSLPFEYFYASSGKGQTAFSTDTPSAYGDSNAADPVDYAASDAFLAAPGGVSGSANGYTYTVAGGSTTVTYPKISTDGALIQLPMLGVGIAFPTGAGAAGITKTAPLKLQDSDLCGIFSGHITNYANLAAKPASLTGPIHVYYRGDSSGTTFLFTNHLKFVCPAGTFPDQAAAPTTTFATLFTGGTIPSNFTAETGSAALAVALGGTVPHKGKSGPTNPVKGFDKQGIGYISPDFTNITNNGAANDIAAPAPATGYINTFALFPAGVLGKNSSNATAYIQPDENDIALAQAKPNGSTGTNINPPTGAAAANPLNWIPVIPTVLEGYPVIGFTTWEAAQCYSNANVAATVRGFLANHFNGVYGKTSVNNGFTLPSKAYRTAIETTFLTVPKTPTKGLTISVAGSGATNTACASVTGR